MTHSRTACVAGLLALAVPFVAGTSQPAPRAATVEEAERRLRDVEAAIRDEDAHSIGRFQVVCASPPGAGIFLVDTARGDTWRLTNMNPADGGASIQVWDRIGRLDAVPTRVRHVAEQEDAARNDAHVQELVEQRRDSGGK